MLSTICLLLHTLSLTSSAINQDSSEVPSHKLRAEHRGDLCNCMEYWSCISKGGSTYSYCGLSESSVCCILPEEAGPQSSFAAAAESTKPKCGVKGFDSGRDGFADPSEWPWHVAVIEDESYFYVCGGTLIDEYWVLTAAHCVDDFVGSKTKLKVRLGEYDVSASTERLPHEDRLVKNIILHSSYDNQSLVNDIALLQLQLPAKQRTHVDVVCLPTVDIKFDERSKCFVTGWGRTSPGALSRITSGDTDDEWSNRFSGSQHSQILKEISIPLWGSAACQESLKTEFGSDYVLPDSVVCAGAQNRDACDGDGGGPLVCQMDGQWFQVGIVSFGIGCGQKDTPGVYSKVAVYEKWIKDTVIPTKYKKT